MAILPRAALAAGSRPPAHSRSKHATPNATPRCGLSPRRDPELRALLHLARLHGIAPTYHGHDGRVRTAEPAVLRSLLAALGARLDPDPATAAQRERRARWFEVVPPVVVTWLPGPAQLELRLPAAAEPALALAVAFEQGGSSRTAIRPGSLRTHALRAVGGEAFRRARWALEGSLPPGYHDAVLEVNGRPRRFLWIAAPRHAHPPPQRATALFAPLYALHSASSPDCADLGDLERFAAWAGELGVALVGTLPLCAGFLEDPVETGPYAPVSRLFWNEVYARPDDAEPGRAPQDREYVDWPAVARDRRERLQRAARRHATDPGPAHDGDLEAFVRARPEVEDFARFRAAQQRYGRNWRAWPARLRDGELRAADVLRDALDYQLYAQWRTAAQLGHRLGQMHERGVGLYLDLPLGTHPDGYDAWAYRDEFLHGCSAGAPPDAFFTRGQSWGFEPQHPRASRQRGHRYFRACLRHQLRHCDLLRVDHVMGLHRIWCVPQGEAADRGVYLRQPMAELFAILTLESVRARCAVIGEDLGTVPVAISEALVEHGVLSMHVAQFMFDPGDPARSMHPPRRFLATINTHDMPTFASFWTAADIDDRLARGLLDEATAREERSRRRAIVAAARSWLGLPESPSGAAPSEAAPDGIAVLEGFLHALARSDADLVVVNVEDLWLETRAQNMPGTVSEHPNWQRRTRPSLEEIAASPDLAERVSRIVAARARGSR